jgi:hypothetical protein
MQKPEYLPVCQAAWYPKAAATFSDALAIVRRARWSVQSLSMSHEGTDRVKIPRQLLLRLTEALGYAT